MKKRSIEDDLAFIETMIYHAQVAIGILEKASKYNIPFEDEMVIDSIAMNIGQIGEQLDSKKLSEEIQRKYADLLEWSEIKKFRDKAYHHYGNMDRRLILGLVKNQLPKLIDNLQFIKIEIEKTLSE